MASNNRSRRRLSAQRGFTLIESILSVVVGAIATLAMVNVDIAATQGTGSAKVQSEALGLAQQKLEQLRGIDSLAAYQALASSTAPDSVAGTAGAFSRSWAVTKPNGTGAPAHAQVSVTVAWQDSDGVGRSVILDSIIAERRPEKSGQWYVAAAAGPGTTGSGGGSEDDTGDGSGGETGGGGGEHTGGGGEETGGGSGGETYGDSGSPDQGADNSNGDPDDSDDPGDVVDTPACSGKEIVGNVIDSGLGQANKVFVAINAGTCTGVSGTSNEASFSCAVACTGTVTLTLGTSQNGASVSPAMANFILDDLDFFT